MIFEQLRIGGDRNFTYLIADEQTKTAAVIDVGYNPSAVIDRLKQLSLKLRYIFATHSHADHCAAIPELKDMTNATYAAFNTVPNIDKKLHHDDIITLGNITIQIIHCPGHTDDGISLLINNEKLITGDQLFVGKVGGTTTKTQAQTQYKNLHEQLMTLDDSIQIWPGHDYGTNHTSTIANERNTNPFLIQNSFDEFYNLKLNWLQYKQTHDIK